MVCTKCQETGILNTAFGKEFYYCRTCKIEIGLEEKPIVEAEMSEEDEAMLNDFVYFYNGTTD